MKRGLWVWAALVASAGCGASGSDGSGGEAFTVTDVSPADPVEGEDITLILDEPGGRSASWYLSQREGDGWRETYVLREGDASREPSYSPFGPSRFFADASPLTRSADLRLPPDVTGPIRVCNADQPSVCIELDVHEQ